MPVKNIKRKTNDGFEGVITGLNDKEKEIIANSVDNVKANPNDEATDTLTKLKVGDTTYDFNRTLVKNGTFITEEGFATLNSFSFTAEEMEKINNGEIDMLIGEFNKPSETSYYNAKRYYSGDDDMPLFICSSYTLMNGESIHYDEVQIYPSLGQGGMISVDSPFIPELPSDASTKKYTLKAVNGTLTWVDLATDSETFNNITVNGNAGVQGNLTTVGKVLTQGGLEVYGNSVFTKDISTSATLKGAHVVAGTTELLPVTPNPADEATETLSKLKVGNTTYGPLLTVYDSSLIFDEGFNIKQGTYNKLKNLLSKQNIAINLSPVVDRVVTYLGECDGSVENNGKNGLMFGITNITYLDGKRTTINTFYYVIYEDDTFANGLYSSIPSVDDIPNYSTAYTYVLKVVNGKIDWVKEQ